MAKKTFKDSIANPAELFIGTGKGKDTAETEKPTKAKKATETTERETVPADAETRSQRLQLLVKPSLLRELKQRAHDEYRSTNDLINSILEEAIQGRG